ncbi:hypothetical protein [Streptomyces sp. W007]|uniref:hypothetical protein n=1 Tax=Streptomyces sp. W007 TaxID=1055352 RepID=UPI00031B18BD|nr:hypothetical protein [Streptomyces sp. W007]
MRDVVRDAVVWAGPSVVRGGGVRGGGVRGGVVRVVMRATPLLDALSDRLDTTSS